MAKENYFSLLKIAEEYNISGDTLNAQKYYEKAYELEKNSGKAALNLIAIYLNTERFNQARKVLNHISSLPYDKIIMYKAILENYEGNFLRSQYNFQKLLDSDVWHDRGLFGLAEVAFSLGEYEEAQKIAQSLTENPKYSAKSIFLLVNMYASQREYQKAYDLLLTIDVTTLNYKRQSIYYFLKRVLEAKLNGIKANASDSLYYSYLSGQSAQESKEKLIYLLLNKDACKYKHNDGSLFKSLDYNFFIDELRDRINEMNGIHEGDTDFYRMTMDYPVGSFKDGTVTQDVCVKTRLGSKDIIDIYPACLSDEFDMEGFVYSDELKRKRNL